MNELKNRDAKRSEKETDEKNLEEELLELEEIVDALSKEELPLSDAFRLYEEGIQKVRECQSTIEGVEKKMQILCEDGSLEEFDDI